MRYDSSDHYRGNSVFIKELNLAESPRNIRNAGWTLGNFCPYNCNHCYSMSARNRGANIEKWMVSRIVKQLIDIGVNSINLGGNEPLFTNGSNPHDTLLPYIIDCLFEHDIKVGLTTSSISYLYLDKENPSTLRRLNDVDISLDSPFENEHNTNRGSNLYSMAIKSLETARKHNQPRSIIMCAMNWNFTPRHIVELVELAKCYGAHVRINSLKPIEPSHIMLEPTKEQFYLGYKLLSELCNAIEVSEPLLSTVSKLTTPGGCPCGKNSFRIHSITPNGEIPVSPCVYLHDFKVGNLLKDDLLDIIDSIQFKLFRQRHANPEKIDDCADCSVLTSCRGGCAARAYLNSVHRWGEKNLFHKDPLCSKPTNNPGFIGMNNSVSGLVHQNYLCTWIGMPK